MKILKIIGCLIGLVLIIFLLTGAVVKETVYQTEIEINKPVTEVFTAFTDTELLKEWVPEIKAMETIIETPNKVGSKYKMTIVNEGKTVEMLEEVLVYEENKAVTFLFDADDMLKTDAYIFTDKGGVTLISKSSTCKSDSYIMSCMFPYLKSMLKKIDQDYLDRFKKVVEK